MKVRYFSTSARIEICLRSTFWLRASVSSRSSGPSQLSSESCSASSRSGAAGTISKSSGSASIDGSGRRQQRVALIDERREFAAVAVARNPVHRAFQPRARHGAEARKSGVLGKRGSVRVDPGGRRIIKKKKKK